MAHCANNETAIPAVIYTAVWEAFGSVINPNRLANYANQIKPLYIVKDNPSGNPIPDQKATIGRDHFMIKI